MSFPQLWEGAETRLNHSNSFRCGGSRPMFNVGCDNVEKRHLFLVFVGYVRQHRNRGLFTFREFGCPARLFKH